MFGDETEDWMILVGLPDGTGAADIAQHKVGDSEVLG